MHIVASLFWLLALVWVHEAGHYVAARRFGVAVEGVTIGFGPVLWTRARHGRPTWTLRALPLLAHVSMRGSGSTPPHVRLCVALAGPLANYLCAGAIIFGLALSGQLDVGARDSGPATFVGALRLSVLVPAEATLEQAAALLDLIRAGATERLQGPVGIGQQLGRDLQQGTWSFLARLVLLSIGLGFFNLLPVPGLDGGTSLFAGYELLTRRKLAAHIEQRAQRFGAGGVLTSTIVVSVSELFEVSRGLAFVCVAALAAPALAGAVLGYGLGHRAWGKRMLAAYVALASLAAWLLRDACSTLVLAAFWLVPGVWFYLRAAHAQKLLAAEAAQPAPVRTLDDDVRFSVYRPSTLVAGQWTRLLAFAYTGGRSSAGAERTPSPVERVRQQAAALLGPQAAQYEVRTEDAGHGFAHADEITFLPQLEGVDCEPKLQRFRWVDDVHHAEFRLKAREALIGQTAHGRLIVMAGPLIVAEVNLSIPVCAAGSERPIRNSERVDAPRVYRKIFASYAHADKHLVSQIVIANQSLGDRYLIDRQDLRAGEVWSEALARLIDDADTFQLFWSRNSMVSRFVRQEWEYALSLERPDFVRPVYWETPRPAMPEKNLPPPELDRLQFYALPALDLSAVEPAGASRHGRISWTDFPAIAGAFLLVLQTGSMATASSAAKQLTDMVASVNGHRPEPMRQAAEVQRLPPDAAVVPELSTEGALPALYLIAGAVAIMRDRRRPAAVTLPHARCARCLRPWRCKRTCRCA